MTGAAGAVDVAIVGAGPAGAAAGLLLARAGFDVLLLDRQAFPRHKPCGDCLSPQAARVLGRLGLLAAVAAQHPARLTGWRVVAPDESSLSAEFSCLTSDAATALALPRHRLDRILLDGAISAGAAFLPRFHATDLLRDRGGSIAGVSGRDGDGRPREVRARLVIGADGLRSIVARRIGALRRAPRLRKISLTAHARGVTGLGSRGEMHVIDGACAGVAAVSGAADPGDVVYNVTLVVGAERCRDAIRAHPERFFRSELARFPDLAPKVAGIELEGDGGRSGAKRTGGRLLPSGPFDWPTRTVIADGAALVGDAAGYYDPFTGQGIYQGLASAEILAEEAAGALRSGGASAERLGRYEQRRRRLLRGARGLQQVVELVVSRPRAANVVIRRIGRTQRVADALIAATADLGPARSLLAPGLLLALLRSFLASEVET